MARLMLFPAAHGVRQIVDCHVDKIRFRVALDGSGVRIKLLSLRGDVYASQLP